MKKSDGKILVHHKKLDTARFVSLKMQNTVYGNINQDTCIDTLPRLNNNSIIFVSQDCNISQRK